jgi:isoleucyl-tRNA synthetase
VLVANLYDFDPLVDAVPRHRMLEIDRWALAKYAECAEKIVAAYDDYDYPAIFQAANTFITVDLSAFYVDVTKDRMYTLGAKSEPRRSGQTAMLAIVDGLARLLAPVLSVTMDELWRTLPGSRLPSVHMALFPMGDEIAGDRNPELLARWTALSAVRDEVNLALEQKRQEQVIKANLSAQVRLEAAGDEARLLHEYRAFLPTLFGVSHVELATDGPEVTALRSQVNGAPATGRRVTVSRAEGVKCDRCWRVVPSVSRDAGTEGLCPRCVDALAPAAHA